MHTDCNGSGWTPGWKVTFITQVSHVLLNWARQPVTAHLVLRAKEESRICYQTNKTGKTVNMWINLAKALSIQERAWHKQLFGCLTANCWHQVYDFTIPARSFLHAKELYRYILNNVPPPSPFPFPLYNFPRLFTTNTRAALPELIMNSHAAR